MRAVTLGCGENCEFGDLESKYVRTYDVYGQQQEQLACQDPRSQAWVVPVMADHQLEEGLR